MARPETTDDVTDRKVRLAVFHVEEFDTDAELASCYAAFLTTLQTRDGYTVTKEYGNVVHRPKTEAELETALKHLQKTWDYREKAYIKAVDQGSDGLKDYEVNSIRSFAKAEGLADPFEREIGTVA